MANQTFATEIAEKLSEQIRTDPAPWQKTWSPGLCPFNPTTGKQYRGTNSFRLVLENRTDPRWLTFKQASDQGYKIKKGEKGTKITIYTNEKTNYKRDENANKTINPTTKQLETEDVTLPKQAFQTYYVFNAEQIEGIPPLEKTEPTWNSSERAENIFAAVGCDTNDLPIPKENCETAEEYSDLLLHEASHAALQNINRSDKNLPSEDSFHEYSRKKLRVEIASMMIRAELQLNPDPFSADSSVSWIEGVDRIDSNSIVFSDEVFRAAQDAEKIKTYVFEREKEYNLERQKLINEPEILKNPEKEKIEDFGEKIGGARKDIAALKRIITIEDAENWTLIERDELINKKQLWKAPDYQAMVDNGLPIEVAFFIQNVRASAPAKPANNTKECQDRYINFIGAMREATENLKTISDAKVFFDNHINEKFAERIPYYSTATYAPTKEGKGCITTKLLRAAKYNSEAIARGISKKRFLYTDDEKLLSSITFHKYDGKNISIEKMCDKDCLVYSTSDGRYTQKHYFHRVQAKYFNLDNWKPDTYFAVDKNRQIIDNNFITLESAKETLLKQIKEHPEEKKEVTRKHKLLPRQLEHIKRFGGKDYREGRDITGDDMLNSFKFRGGEFGNWENQKDRQTNLNMSYEAFSDLAAALNIKQEDVSLGNNLAIAYGARGRSSALAHYELSRNVINLTKMKGAGSLAHEWGHALDAFVAQKTLNGRTYATETYQKNILTPVIDTMCYKVNENGVRCPSNFLKESRETDQSYSKENNGYWASNVEMFARSFACYVHDKLQEKGIRSDFLCGHSECTVFPKGEERKAINSQFDMLIDKMKEMELLHSPSREVNKDLAKSTINASLEKAKNLFQHNKTSEIER